MTVAIVNAFILGINNLWVDWGECKLAEFHLPSCNFVI